MDISVVVPVYGSASCLPELLRQLSETLEALGRPYEILLIDDASPDGAWKVISQLTEQYKPLRAIRLMKNGGQAKATFCGLTHAKGDIVITMDDDLQHRPDQLPMLIDTLERNPEIDCVFGIFPEKKHAGYRNLGSRAMRWLNARAFGLPPGLSWSSFRVMRAKLARAITRRQTDSPVIAAELFGSTNRVLCVPIPHDERFAGESNYTLVRQLRLAVDNICSVSTLPLRAVAVMGMLFCLFSLLFLAFVMVKYMTGQVAVAGWTSIVIFMSFFAGVTLLSLGVIGEYLVRILRQVRGAPRFVMRESLGFDPDVELADER